VDGASSHCAMKMLSTAHGQKKLFRKKFHQKDEHFRKSFIKQKKENKNNQKFTKRASRLVKNRDVFMGHLTLKVCPGSKSQDIIIHKTGEDSHRSKLANEAVLTVRLCEKAVDNKANLALCKLLKKLTGHPVRIISGASSRIKVVGFSAENIDFLSSLQDSISR
jgi:uncharacterized protein YggU (UPF0235/DUF167 family)